MGGMLEWDQPECDFFRNILAHPTLIPYLHTFVGKGYRLDHSPLLISMKEGSEGHTLHGGAVSETGGPAWNIAYDCRQGNIRTQLLTVSVNLTATGPGDGGFCIVPGSHKANFPTPGTTPAPIISRSTGSTARYIFVSLRTSILHVFLYYQVSWRTYRGVRKWSPSLSWKQETCCSSPRPHSTAHSHGQPSTPAEQQSTASHLQR
jgi:hypothetical protein